MAPVTAAGRLLGLNYERKLGKDRTSKSGTPRYSLRGRRIEDAYGESPPPPAPLDRRLWIVQGAQHATNDEKPMVLTWFLCLSGRGRRAERKVGEGTKSVRPSVWQLIGGTRLQNVRNDRGKHWQELSVILEPFGPFGVPFWGHFGVVGARLKGFGTQVAGQRRLGEVFGRSGSPWRPSGNHLGPFLGDLWGHLGPSWGRQGPSWGPLVAILGRLGAILGRLGAPLGLSKGLWEPPRRSESES